MTTTECRPPLDLTFETRAGQTVLARRHVTYPFFITAPLRGRGPDAEIVIQSISGGLFGGERVAQRVTLGSGATAIIRMPSATIVHDRRDKAAAQCAVSLQLADSARLDYLPRPTILLPGSMLVQSVDLTLGPGATALLQDSVLMHDPNGMPTASRALDNRISIQNSAGRLIARDRMMITDANGEAGPYRAFGTLWLVAEITKSRYKDIKFLISSHDWACYWGMTQLRADSGIMIRFAARDGGDLDSGMTRMREMLLSSMLDL
ncbi:urease accessory protein UreD [Acidisoma silvae]|uniref:Urease accessory protein UreD n=1 Tax=Acidisoma silvae TaxID=2802396 RepID=A0A963YVU3_9PROT|nr:urease accessory protein UreD [Acidisoma silvae]MCB8877073.1 urease accessory protein UreD [Acidisoma silvae]